MDLSAEIKKTLLPGPAIAPFPAVHNSYVLQQVLERWTAYEEWYAITVKHYPDVASITIETEAQYNDEGGYWNHVTGVAVYDRHKSLLNDDMDVYDKYLDDVPTIGAPPSEALYEMDFQTPKLTGSYTKAQVQQLFQMMLIHLDNLPDHCFFEG